MYLFTKKIRSPAEAKTAQIFCIADLQSFYCNGTLSGEEILQLQFVGDFHTIAQAREFLIHQETAFNDIIKIFAKLFKESELKLNESNCNR